MIRDAHGITLEQIDLLDLKDMPCRGYALRGGDIPGMETFSSLEAAHSAWLSAVRRMPDGSCFQAESFVDDAVKPYHNETASAFLAAPHWRGILIGMATGIAVVVLVWIGFAVNSQARPSRVSVSRGHFDGEPPIARNAGAIVTHRRV